MRAERCFVELTIYSEYLFRMALVRILIDGYSLLHGWPELAPGKARHSAAARDELIHHLTLYHDAVGTPLTIVFDGANTDRRLSTVESTPQVEILYSRAGQTADQIIERVTHRLSPYGEVLAVTDDNAERDTVIAMGGMASSCLSFIQSINAALAEQQDDLKVYNRAERQRFKRSK
jgi:predicted RNA-binding protein with PIN domain